MIMQERIRIRNMVLINMIKIDNGVFMLKIEKKMSNLKYNML